MHLLASNIIQARNVIAYPALVRVLTATYRSGTQRFKAHKAVTGGARAGEFLQS